MGIIGAGELGLSFLSLNTTCASPHLSQDQTRLNTVKISASDLKPQPYNRLELSKSDSEFNSPDSPNPLSLSSHSPRNKTELTNPTPLRQQSSDNRPRPRNERPPLRPQKPHLPYHTHPRPNRLHHPPATINCHHPNLPPNPLHLKPHLRPRTLAHAPRRAPHQRRARRHRRRRSAGVRVTGGAVEGRGE